MSKSVAKLHFCPLMGRKQIVNKGGNMKIKILFISCLILLMLGACQDNSLKDLKIHEYVYEKKETKTKSPKKEPKEKETTTKIITTKKNVTTTKKTTKPKNEVTITTDVPDDSVDEESIDYPIHKGRIDCSDLQSCQELSLPMQFKYKDVIANAMYLEVISKNNHILGYFIEYFFNSPNYETNDECINVGKALKQDLNDKITSYTCIDNTLSIIANY